MKTKKLFRYFAIIAVAITLNCTLGTLNCFSQCLPMIKIDGNDIIADENNSAGIKLPSWLKTGQTLEKGQYVFSIAVIEFTVNGTTLDYSQNLSVTTMQTVPASKVWKIESIHKDATIAIPPPATTFTSGTTPFSPTCNGTFRVQVWGGGGGGDGGDGGSCSSVGGGGGGGGGYSEGNFYLLAGTVYSVVVGAGGTAGTYATSATGGTGGTSSVSVIGISATGGAGGLGWCAGTGGAAGTGAGGQINASGQAGVNGVSSSAGGKGGDGANGGAGGTGTTTVVGVTGAAPGGGGGGSGYAWGTNGGPGGAGRVIISMTNGGSGSSGSGSRDKLQAANVVNATVSTACGYSVPFGYVFRLDGVFTNSGGQTLNMGTTCGGTDRGTITVYNPLTGSSGTATQGWPYPQWFVGGTYFRFSSGNAYIQGMEFTIDQ